MSTRRPGKALYMMSAVAQRYNIHPQTLRLYEREGLLRPSRTDGNTRLYSDEDSEAARNHPDLDARTGREPRRRRDYPPPARAHGPDAARGQRVHGVRQAGNGARTRRLGAAAVHGDGQECAGIVGAPTSTRPTRPITGIYLAFSLAVRLSSRVLRAIMPTPWTWTANSCNGTGWKTVEHDGHVVSPGVTAGAEASASRRRADAHSPPLPALRFLGLPDLRQRIARTRARIRAVARTALPRVGLRSLPARSTGRRQDAPRGGRSADPAAGEGRTGNVLRHT